MPTTHKLQVGTWNVTITNIPEVKREYVKVDKDNNELGYSKGSVTKGYYFNPVTKDVVQNVYSRINGKPAEKPKRTESTNKFKEVEIMETFDLMEGGCYLVENVPFDLLEKLKSGLAIKILYTPGSETNYGYIRINPFHKEVELIYGTTYKSKIIEEIKEVSLGKKKVKEITLQEDGVQRVTAEEIMEL